MLDWIRKSQVIFSFCVGEKPSSSFLPKNPVSSLWVTQHFISDTAGHQTCGVSPPQQVILNDVSSVSFSLAQSWLSPGDSFTSHRWRAHPTELPFPLQMPVTRLPHHLCFRPTPSGFRLEVRRVDAVTEMIFMGSKITADSDCSHKIKTLALWKESYNKPRQYIKKQRHHFVNNCLYSQSYGFSGSPVWMWELEVKKAECQELMLSNCGAGENSWESPGLLGDQTSQS